MLFLFNKRLYFLNKLPTTFSIKDLENLSGIKAHTIRIWEKRYNILIPERTNTNIRSYNLANLQKLLNVTFLYNAGIKISKLGKLSNDEIKEAVLDLAAKKGDKDYYLDELKLSMVTFDQFKFEQTYSKMISEMSFREMFTEVFIPLLEYIGLQWLSDSITPSHEHFVTSLIMQKLLINIERVQSVQPNKGKVFVLFLPDNEIHELGLLYLNYELSREGHQTIYLGPSVPIASLESIVACYPELCFVSYFTVSPPKSEVDSYLKAIDETLLTRHDLSINLLGKNAQEATYSSDRIRVFNDVVDMLNKITV
ncbi:MAG: MerR family transcriptional regulator [Flavobacteriales bacterium]|nr:MerR family transcriptional regulator [Flavobacteriales bacterium]